jgi:hypothetical protein
MRKRLRPQRDGSVSLMTGKAVRVVDTGVSSFQGVNS